MTLGFHHTGKPEYLSAAQRAADFFLSQLPDDQVPAWDFRAPLEIRDLRDSSAGSCAASGLLLLAEKLGDASAAAAAKYRERGERILKSLYDNYGAWDDPSEEGLILHGTSNYPQGTNIDVPLIYGDYFFAEGLARLKDGGASYWE
ncbi:Unsaturated glucuronyl hydrolase [compost metagenome]